MKSFAMLLIGVSLAISATGCCCLNPCGSACGYAGYGGGCSSGACSPGYPAVVPQTGFYNGVNPSQFTAAPAPSSNMIAAAPTTFAQTAMAGPLDPLPTF